MAALAANDPAGVGIVEPVGFAGGFFLCLFVSFVSISVQRLESGDSI